MTKASGSLQELRRKIYRKAKTDFGGSGVVGKISTDGGVCFEATGYSISTRKRLRLDRWIGLGVKRAGKLYERKPHARFDVAGDGKVQWRT